MLHGVLHQGLQGQRRQAEICNRRIVLHEQHVLKLRLLHRKVGAGMLQFSGKRNRTVTGHGVEIPAKVVGEIHRDLTGFLRILVTETVDAHQGIIDEVRPHLQYHDTGSLIGDFQLVAPVLFDLLGQGKAIHGQSG